MFGYNLFSYANVEVCDLLTSHQTATLVPCLCARCDLTGLIATACGDDCIRVFEEDKNSVDPVNQPSFNLMVTASRAHSQDVNCTTWNPVRPGLLASCSDDGRVKWWQYSGES